VSIKIDYFEVEMASNDEADIPCPLMGLIGRRMNPSTDKNMPIG
jgi:hypothetical protein